MSYELESSYRPRGDQGQAIAKLLKSVEAGNRHQTLLGVTGSGKTFTMANVIRELDRPTLIISHNKTLAAQLYSEFKQFFPRNAVEYFVSYFDYYQPEAYIPRSDTYIEKDSSINEEIERLRLSATSALLSRRDTIVVASVSCIYGVASPEDYLRMLLTVKRGQQISREAVLGRLVDMLYERNDVTFVRGRFRVRGDVVEVYPATADEEAVRLEFFGDEIDAITRFDPLTGHAHESLGVMTFFPAKQFVTPADKLNRALTSIRDRAGPADRPTRITGEIARGATPENAHGIRSRDDAGDGFLQRHRELFAASLRPPAGLEAIHTARFFPEGFSARDRRIARHHSADRRHV